MPINCCPRCKRTDVEFPFAHRKSYTCRGCLREASRKWMAANRKSASRNRKSDSYEHRANTPEKKAKLLARSKIRNAVRAGKFDRLPCAVCGELKAEAHHEDYSKPFDVLWLCRKHHSQLHLERRNAFTVEA